MVFMKKTYYVTVLRLFQHIKWQRQVPQEIKKHFCKNAGLGVIQSPVKFLDSTATPVDTHNTVG